MIRNIAYRIAWELLVWLGRWLSDPINLGGEIPEPLPRYYVVRCGCCGRITRPNLTLLGALDQAVSLRWSYQRRAWFCRECVRPFARARSVCS